MKSLINFIKNMLGFETEADIIGLSKFAVQDTIQTTTFTKTTQNKEASLTELLRRLN